MKRARDGKRRVGTEKSEEPPMTSMIDIVFQLLIFFILTLQIKSVEGKLINQLPKIRGIGPGTSLEMQEVRIVLCCGEGLRHQENKGLHEARLEAVEITDRADTAGKTHSAHLVLNDVCTAWVGKNPLGNLYKTWVCREGHVEEKGRDVSKRVSENALRYREIAARTKELHDAMPSPRGPKKPVPVILDMDGAVPYEHIIGVINALKELGIQNVEFVGNARHERYYGSGQEGQFQSNRDRAK